MRNILAKVYPGLVVPLLSEKSIQKNSNQVVEKRKVYLEYFLMEILKTPEFKNSKFFVDFLRLDEKKFRQVKKDSEKIGKPCSFENLINMNGYVKFKLDSNVKQSCTSFEGLLTNEDSIYLKFSTRLNY